MSAVHLPRLYAIVDFKPHSTTRTLLAFIEKLLAAGVTCLQYRNKLGSSREILSHAREIKRISWGRAVLIMNDRADLCLAADFEGVHLGQDDLEIESARKILGPKRIVGASTHNQQQFAAACKTSADYIAVGPVFATSSKENPDPSVGIEFVRHASAQSAKPLVAIGGITRENCRSVIEAGARSVAVIRDLEVSPREKVREFLRLLG